MRSLHVSRAIISSIAALATTISAATKPSAVAKIMVVGDSLSHGFEGDHTWRYRLWEWFLDQKINATFVGRHSGTYPQVEGLGPVCNNKTLFKQISDGRFKYPVHDGLYAEDIRQDWPSAHSSMHGQLVERLSIKNMTKEFQPDYIFIQLGMNDLLHKNDEDQTFYHLRRLVDDAREAKRKVKVAIATIPGLRGSPAVPYTYNDRSQTLSDMIEDAVKEWDSPASPVVVVHLRTNYECLPVHCPAAWDGTNPNELGEYQIASAFSRMLHERFKFGKSPLRVPSEADISERPVPVPTNFKVELSPWGFKLTWDKVVSAHKYEVARRKVNTTDWRIVLSGNGYEFAARRYDVLDAEVDEEWEFKVRVNNGEASGNEQLSEWSPVQVKTANMTTDMCKQDLISSKLSAGPWWSSKNRVSFLPYVAIPIIFVMIYEVRRRHVLHLSMASQHAYAAIH